MPCPDPAKYDVDSHAAVLTDVMSDGTTEHTCRRCGLEWTEEDDT